MAKLGKHPLPRWLFAILTVGGLLASGIYLGIISTEGASTGLVLRAVGFGVFGLLMLWGSVSNPE
jgi:hypothetical protein